MNWIYSLPTWLAGTITLLVFIVLSVGALFAVRRFVGKGRGSQFITNEVIEPFFSGALILYGITLGLITVATWDNYSGVEDAISSEAAAITALYRDVSGYPEPERSRLQQELYDYTRFIIDIEWPAQQRGEVLEQGTRRLTGFEITMLAFDPVSTGDQIVHAQAFDQYNQMVELRRTRIEAIGNSIPGVLWIVVVIGAVFTLGIGCLFRVDDFVLHAFLIGSTAALIALLIFLIAVLDNPYQGDARIQPRPYQMAINGLMVIPESTPEQTSP